MKFIFLLFATIGLGLTGTATELSGVVKSEDGKPLSGVQILTYAPAGPADILGMHVETSTKRYEVSTRSDGSFSIPSHRQFVYFHRADLRPLTKIVDLAIKQIQVTMEEGSRTLWKIPACSPTDKSTRVGIGFMLTVPKNMMVKKDEKRFEDGGYLFGYRVGEQIEVLINWWESTSLEPAEKYLLESRSSRSECGCLVKNEDMSFVRLCRTARSGVGSLSAIVRLPIKEMQRKPQKSSIA